MAKSLESPTKLTEFAPLNAEAQQAPGLRSTFARWFGINNKTNPPIREVPENAQPPSRSPSRDDISVQSSDTASTVLTYSEGRTLVSVLTRVSNLLAQKGTYNEAEFKQYWMPDSVSKECYECSYKFTALRRRHHCRICGQIFCSRCCHQQVPGKLMGYSGDLRACTYCCHIVLSCLQSIDTSSDLSTDLKRVQEDLQKKLALLQPGQTTSSTDSGSSSNESMGRSQTLKRKASVSFQEERFACGANSAHNQLISAERKALLHDSNQLKALHEELGHPQRGIQLQSHRYKLRSVANCCIGSEIVDWLLVQDKATSRIQAVAIGQALTDAQFLECVSSTEQLFIDGYCLYRPRTTEPAAADANVVGSGSGGMSLGGVEDARIRAAQVDDAQEPLWAREIKVQEDARNRQAHSSESEEEGATGGDSACGSQPQAPRGSKSLESHHRDLLESLRSAKLNSRLRRGDELLLSAELNPQLPAQLGSPTVCPQEFSPQSHESKVLADLFDEHSERLMKQLLSAEGLPLSWADVLMPLVSSVAYTVRPDVKDDDDDMDIRQYVHVKKVSGGVKADSRLIHGVVCSKNVANRNMAKWIHDPKILLLSSAIDYQRVGSKLISLEPLMMQENEYLKNAVAKIAAFRPEVLLVEKVVSGLAQEFLLDLGVTLILNVKASVMDRVSRCCQADIVPSIDAHITRPRLGSCRLFRVETPAASSLINGPGGGDGHHNGKTLMFFDGCQPRLGCTVLLRGAGQSELRRVKKVVRFMIFACYNARMERAFLADEFAIPRMPGSVPLEIFDDSCSRIEHPQGLTSSPIDIGGNNGGNVTFDSSSLVVVDSASLIIDDSDDAGQPERPERPESARSGGVPACSKDNTVEASAIHLKSVSDLDDPLHEYLRSRQCADQSLESTPVDFNIHSSITVHSSSSTSNTMLLRKAMEDTILSVSPLIRRGLPYLETEAGRNAPLRKFLPDCLYHSQQMKQESPPRKSKYDAEGSQVHEFRVREFSLASGDVHFSSDVHPFLRAKITPAMSRNELMNLLADFRAKGSRPKASGDQQRPAKKLSAVSEGLAADDQPDQQRSVDCLDPFQLQRLHVLFSSYCPTSANAPNFCVPPWVIQMDFYGRNDITLGGFLERFCFNTNYACPSASCQSPMTAHVRRFVHDTSCILVIIRQLANPVNCNAAAGIGDDRSILMWSWCKKCKQVSPIATMSAETWHFSFAKYLELRFHGAAYCRRQMAQPAGSEPPAPAACACPHPLHTEHFHYFGCRDLVASFKYTPVTLREIVLAPSAMSIQADEHLVAGLIEEVRSVAQCGHGLYAAIGEWLAALTAECVGTKLEGLLGQRIDQQIQERSRFRKSIEEIQLMLTSPNLQTSPIQQPAVEDSLWHILDQEILLKRFLAEMVTLWNAQLQDIVAAKKKEDKAAASSASLSTSTVKASSRSLASNPSSMSLDADGSRSAEVSAPAGDPTVFAFSPNSSREEVPAGTKASDTSCSSLSSSPSNKTSPFLRFRSSSDMLANTSPSSAEPHLTSSRAEEGPESVPGSKEHRRTVSQTSNEPDPPDGRPLSEAKTVSSAASRVSLNFLLSTSGAGSPLLTSPFPPTEHHLLPPGFSVPLVVYENEPSSIIAYALASVDYQNQLADLQVNLADQAVPSPPRSTSQIGSDRWFDTVEREDPGSKSMGLSVPTGSSSSTGGGSTSAGPSGPSPSAQHLEIQFSDASTKFYCRVYYAEQFRALRAKVFPAGEERFIRSLSRCVPWAASGGKSGSTFCKTLDDRFVLKQMSKMEIQSFVDLAPNYVAHLAGAHRDNRPTTLCKIVGAFRIVFKNAQTTAASKQDLLVMENLFYRRSVSRKFDLKGSERNRLVATTETGLSDCVLLDENLIKMIWENPLYVRDLAPSVLNSALKSDTQFLASQLVMDYSLLVGIDDDSNQLIVGIIDYIRTFTWDKRLETFVKSSGILGGQGKMPTVVSPELYRTRFCEAMNRYFLGVPDQWTGLANVNL